MAAPDDATEWPPDDEFLQDMAAWGDAAAAGDDKKAAEISAKYKKLTDT